MQNAYIKSLFCLSVILFFISTNMVICQPQSQESKQPQAMGKFQTQYQAERMDQQGHSQAPSMGVIGSGAQLSYATNPYQTGQMTGAPAHGSVVTSVGAIQSTSQPSGAQLAQHLLAYQHIHHQQQQLQQQLQTFWANQYQEIEMTDFKNHSLPLARIKKIMKVDEDVRMISDEALVIFARACEMFILELTLRSWNHTEENKRRTLQKNDITATITRTDIFDFLVDTITARDSWDDHE